MKHVCVCAEAALTHVLRVVLLPLLPLLLLLLRRRRRQLPGG
jgi:hypothetical protein